MQKKNQSQSHQFEKLGSNNQIPLFNYSYKNLHLYE